MKLLSALALTACLAIVGCSESGSQSGAETAANIVPAKNQVLANIDGMTCSGCSGEVSAAVEKIDGVAKAYADPKTGEVTIALKDDIENPEAVKQAIQATITGLSDGKYTINKINAYTAGEGGGEPGTQG